MSRRRPRPSESNFALSFIDTISGGFGAAFFLFLIFASMPMTDDAAASGGSGRFLEIWVRWDGLDELGEIELTYDDRRPIRLTSASFKVDGETGKLTSSDVTYWKSAFASGFSWFGEARMKSPDGTRSATRLRLAEPCPGQWRIRIRLHSRPAGDDWFVLAEPVVLKANVVTYDGLQEFAELASEGSLTPGGDVVLLWRDVAGAEVGEALELKSPRRFEVPPYCL